VIVDRPVGIDLGTTNSEIAMLTPSEREVLVYQDRFGRKTVPSAVAWDPKKEEILVGRPAKQRRGQDPAPIESIKRRMGRTDRVLLGPRETLPEEVSALILGELRGSMTKYLAERTSEGVTMAVKRAVITVPAYFDAPQVEATRKAGELAGLSVLGVLQEPTAAAIYQTWKNKIGDGHVLVYDLGGGTFDVSILRCLAGEYQVLAIDGDNFLGGDDLDRRYAEKLRKELTTRGWALDLDVRGDAEDRARFARLVHIAQEIKESLSTSEVLAFKKDDVLLDKNGESVSIELEVARTDWEAAVADLVETTITCAKRAIARSVETAAVGLEKIDHVVLVGGSTRVPLVQRRVREVLCEGREPLADDVDTVVALGAAVHAAQLGGLRLEKPGCGRVTFLSPLVATGDKIRLSVRAEESVSGSSIAVRDLEGNDLAQAEIEGAPSESAASVRLDVPLPAVEGDVPLHIVVGDGGPIPFEVYRGELRPRASALSRATVVPKDLGLEIVRSGRRERAVLVPRGTGLPSESSHVFFTSDQSGAVVLKLLQDRMPIKTLVLQVPKELGVGTMVELKVRCDETMRIEARAKVGGRELWAAVEPSEQARFAGVGEVEALIERAERVKRDLWGSYAEAYGSEADRLISGIREVVGTDPPKLDALCAQLSTLVEEFQADGESQLAPPLSHFEGTLNALRRVVYRASGALLGLDRDGWEEKLRSLDEEARAAWQGRDATAWRRSFNELQALHETATQEEFAQMRLDDPAYVSRLLRRTVQHENELSRSLADFVPSAAADVRALQLAERDRLQVALASKVGQAIELARGIESSDPNEARRKLDVATAELERIEAALGRIPQVGLVSERGGNQS
jgi:molecular chaperone DnaK